MSVSQVTPSLPVSPIPGSSLYGRKYQLQVFLPPAPGANPTQDVLTVSDSDFEPEALKITFDIFTPCFSNYWYADIDIYNFDSVTTSRIIAAGSNVTQGMVVILKAGYQNGLFDVIWQGPVFQPIFSRDNVVDFKITLRCILSLESVLTGKPLSVQYGANFNQTETILAMLNSIGVGSDYLSPNLSSKKYSRGDSLFGSPDKVLREFAEDNNMVWFLGKRGINLGALNDGQASTSTTASGIKYSPSTGLVFSPQQTQAGVDFTVLLDPRVRAQIPLMVVALDKVVIQQFKRSIGEQVLPLDQDGTYVVGAVHHRGDSRGGPWYTEITGYEKTGSALAGFLGGANVYR